MQVLTTFGMRIVSIPTGSNGSKGPDVFFLSAGIEDEPLAERLEEGKIGVGLEGLLIDVVVGTVSSVATDGARGNLSLISLIVASLLVHLCLLFG